MILKVLLSLLCLSSTHGLAYGADLISCRQNQDVADLEKFIKNLSVNISECSLVPSAPTLHGIDGLSAYWAQEYTGADLVRERFELINIDPGLIEVWDSNSHGESVANLIAGPKNTALIPTSSKAIVRYVDGVYNTESAHVNAVKDCLESNTCGKYINNSIGWNNNKTTAEAIEKVSNNSVFVTSADNEANLTDDVKRALAAKEKILIVGSLSPDGRGSLFTNYAPEVVISAPSDNSILSYNDDEPVRFGGTSGAAPQITAALAYFTAVTGYQLNTSESKLLLEKTALPFTHYPGPNSLGAGMLNSYKISEIAFRLKDKCQMNRDCITKHLIDPDTYKINVDTKQITEDVSKAFPECVDESKELNSGISNCSERKTIFKKLRKAVFLNHNNSDLWQMIACISEKDGMTKNANFYSSMAKRQSKSDTTLIEELKRGKEVPRHISYLYSYGSWNKNHSWVEELAKYPKNDLYVIQLVASNPASIEISHVIDPIIERDSYIPSIISTILSQPEWANRDDIVIELMKNESYQDRLSIVLGMNHWVQPKLMEKIIQEYEWPVLTKILQYTLSQPGWTKHPELLDQLIKKNTFALDIQIERILDRPYWQEVYQKRLKLNRKVSIADIRKDSI